MTSETRARLVAALRAMKSRRGMRQEDLAAASGIPLRTLADLLRGASDIRGERLDQLAKGMGATVPQLLSLAASADYEDENAGV